MQIQKLIFILLLCPLFSYSQKKHTVGAKETLFSIGRLYNVHPRELAEFNNIPFETGLTLGQVLKIPTEKKMTPPPPVTLNPPANNDNAIKTEVKKIDPPVTETLVPKIENKGSIPIYHTVQKKETLFQISRLYDKVPISDLKKWNNLTTDGVNEGAKIIVGYSNADKKEEKPKEVKVAEEKKAEIVQETKKEEAKISEQTAVKNEEKPVEIISKNEVKEEKIESIKTEIKPQEDKSNEIVKQKEEIKIVEVPKLEIKTEKVALSGKDFKGGYFKAAFDNQKSSGIEESGTAATFKSTSGWEDGKYYCLHNTVPSGTILKITSKSNGKSVYAKVLDVMPDLKQNMGILLRMSNAAASALDEKADKFEVELSDK